jgi:HAE1 family hydrophobic/amphiphilic exporter-1
MAGPTSPCSSISIATSTAPPSTCNRRSRPLSTTNDYAEQVFAQQISQLPGVAQVLIFGQQKFAVRVDADPDAAFARGLTLDDIRRSVAAANSSAPIGGLRGIDKNVTLKAEGNLTKAEDFKDIVVAWRNGAPIHLNEIAEVYDSVENDQIAAWHNENRGIALAIFRQSDANTVEVVDNVRNKLPIYQSQLPPSISAAILNDRSRSIRASIEDVQFTLALAIALVILVIFLFLKSAAATVIPSLALPVSLIGTCAIMYLFGYSIDNISLLAVTLAVGFVVDDAIVMLENIVRHIEEGMRPFEAAIKGSAEIAYTITSITLSLVAVFIPVLLMGGIVGRVLREFAVVISCAILVSGFVSLTLTPMLCARLLKPVDHHAKQGLFWNGVDGVINGVTSAYRWTLDVVLRHQVIMMLVTAGTFALSVSMFISIPKGFFPVEDTGFITGSTEATSDIAFPAMAERQKQIARTIMGDPAVDYITSSVGQGGTSQGSVFIALKPKSERGDIQAVITRLRGIATSVPGINAVFSPVQNLNLNGGRASKAPYQYTLQSSDLQSLYKFGPDMLRRLQALPQLKDANSDLRVTNPELRIEIDRAKAGAFGLTADQIRTALYNAYGTVQISTIFTQASDYQVILETAHKLQDDPSALGRVYIRAAAGSAGAAAGSGAPATTGVSNAPIVPLDQVATIKRSVGPLWINRQSQQAAVTISFNTPVGVSIGEAIEAIHKVEAELNLPTSISTNFTGSAALFQDSLKGLGPLLLAAILTIYIVLGVLYESYIHPITILTGLPSACIGALLCLQWFGMDLSVIAIIGVLLLIGIVKKNAIMMIDFALERRRDGVEALPAIREAALIRFRPITMTTLAAILGAVPIAIGAGAGAELRQPLGIAVVGGLCVSQLLTLYITPVVYIWLDVVDSYLSGRAKGDVADEEIEHAPALGQAAE